MKHPLNDQASSSNAVKNHVIPDRKAAQAAPQVVASATQSGPVRQQEKSRSAIKSTMLSAADSLAPSATM
jgi:hypothetical protein